MPYFKYSHDIRWLGVYKRLVRGKTTDQVTKDLEGHVCEDTQRSWILETGSSQQQAGKLVTIPLHGDRPGRP